MDHRLSTSSRIRGCLLGLAIGDALGGPAEFKARGTFPHITDFLPNGNFGLPPGCWTDDTSLTLCLAKALADKDGNYDPAHAIRLYMAWYQEGYMSSTGTAFDVGNATRIALNVWKEHLQYGDSGLKEGQDEVNERLGKKQYCGNGSLMRVSPVGLVFYQTPDNAELVAAQTSEPTHPYPTNREACVLYTRLIVMAMEGRPKEDLANTVPNFGFNDVGLKATLGRYKSLADWASRPSEEIKSSGYVIHTLEAVLWCFFTTNSYEEGVIKAVNLGDDADTVGAIYGGLAGCFYGIESIPIKWVNGLKKCELIEQVIKAVEEMKKRGS